MKTMTFFENYLELCVSCSKKIKYFNLYKYSLKFLLKFFLLNSRKKYYGLIKQRYFKLIILLKWNIRILSIINLKKFNMCDKMIRYKYCLWKNTLFSNISAFYIRIIDKHRRWRLSWKKYEQSNQQYISIFFLILKPEDVIKW